MTAAIEAEWQAPLMLLREASSAYIIGRGPALPIAHEAALKLKETAMLHAEPFSGAEVMHGPLQLVHRGFPVLAFHPKDASFEAMQLAVERLKAAGGQVLVAEEGPVAENRLLFGPSKHPLLDALVMLVSFYDLTERLARARGCDPDQPVRLRKVTQTL